MDYGTVQFVGDFQTLRGISIIRVPCILKDHNVQGLSISFHLRVTLESGIIAYLLSCHVKQFEGPEM
jgi:hypothetical protein